MSKNSDIAEKLLPLRWRCLSTKDDEFVRTITEVLDTAYPPPREEVMEQLILTTAEKVLRLRVIKSFSKQEVAEVITAELAPVVAIIDALAEREELIHKYRFDPEVGEEEILAAEHKARSALHSFLTG